MFESESSLERCSHLFTVLKIPPTLVEIRDHRLAPTHTHTHTHTHSLQPHRTTYGGLPLPRLNSTRGLFEDGWMTQRRYIHTVVTT